MNKKIISYSRCATTKAEADTTRAQKDEIARWADFNGYEVIAHYTDLCTGREMECREGLLQALALADQTGASIAATDLSRISRNVHHISGMLNNQTHFILTRTGRELSREMLLILAVLVESESNASSARVKAGIHNAFIADPTLRERWGQSPGRDAAADLTRGRIEKADRHALKYGEIAYTAYHSGRSYRQIAGLLMNAEIPTSRGHFRWSYSSTRQLIDRFARLTDSPRER